MFRWLKKVNRKLNEFLYNGTPRISKPADCFAFQGDEEKAAAYGECQNEIRHLNSPFLKVLVIGWLAAFLWFAGKIVYYILSA